MQRLSPTLASALRKLGIQDLTDLQGATLAIREDRVNRLLLAPTGSGKTEAAILPVIEDLLQDPGQGILALYITPLRALNRDMVRRLQAIGEQVGLDVKVRHGDTTQAERNRMSKRPPHILVTTPETVQILFTGRRLREHLSRVRWIIIDEVHELAGSERGAQLAVALERLAPYVKTDPVRIGLSATVANPEEVGAYLVGVDRPLRIERSGRPARLRIEVHAPTPDEKGPDTSGLALEDGIAAAVRAAAQATQDHNSVLLFVNTRDTAEFLALQFGRLDLDLPVGIHHGSLSKEVRLEMEQDFRAGRLNALVCTSSLELGIDIGTSDQVVQFASPRDASRLIQRVGRSGHSLTGTPQGLVLATDPDEVLESAVVTARALDGILEPVRIRDLPLGVLANQISAMGMEGRDIVEDEAYRIVSRAHVFRDLSREGFERVIAFLAEVGLIWRNDDGTYRRKRSRLTHFYENLSMIPDERTMPVMDMAARRRIGSLDETFVASHAELGAPFVMKGQAWEILEVTEDEVRVLPCSDPAALPSWIGEDLPVPFAVAQEVGRLRGLARLPELPWDRAARAVVEAYLHEQRTAAEMPTRERILLEEAGRVVIIHICGGNRVNTTLGRILAALISARTGAAVRVRTDAYRILLEGGGLDARVVEQALGGLEPEHVGPLARKVTLTSTGLRRTFIHTARKFGILRKEVDPRRFNPGRLIEQYSGSPAVEEAISRSIWEHMDPPALAAILTEVEAGKITIGRIRPSPMGQAALTKGGEYLVPARATRRILAAVLDRLEQKHTGLICTYCKRAWKVRIGQITGRIRCPRCDSKMVAPVHPFEVDAWEGEGEPGRDLRVRASLQATHGRKAVLALAGRGVGPATAGRILSGITDDELELMRAILTQEITYARTRQFWD